MSADHRLETNEEEREGITASDGEVCRLNTGGGMQIGPLRCWPGGLCLSRSIGDMDVGEYIVPVPHMKQLSPSGGRLVISSDGVWDALSAETEFECCRGMPPDVAASQIVKDKMMDTRGTYSPMEMSDKEILEAVLGCHSVYFQGWGRSSGTTNNKAHGTTTESDQLSNQELVQRLNEANNRLDEVVNILC